jgi:cytochrome c-type biogenesis protein CcmH/NrfG
MKRELVFFVTGLAFGIAAGYFTFRAVTDTPSASALSMGGPVTASGEPRSTIGLDEESEPSVKELDEEEVARLEEKARGDAGDAASRAELGRLYMEAGRYGDAISWLEQAVKLAPDDLHARNHLAICYLNEGRLGQAVAAFEENLSREPNDPPSLLGLGRIKLYMQQDIRGGLAMWEKLVQVAPNSAEAAAVRDELEALKSAHSGS